MMTWGAIGGHPGERGIEKNATPMQSDLSQLKLSRGEGVGMGAVRPFAGKPRPTDKAIVDITA